MPVNDSGLDYFDSHFQLAAVKLLPGDYVSRRSPSCW